MIHINADIGELPDFITFGGQQALLQHLTAVNIACGGHAGTPETMRISVEQSRALHLQIGAHPGCPDMADEGKYKSTEIYGRPTDPALIKEYETYLQQHVGPRIWERYKKRQ